MVRNVFWLEDDWHNCEFELAYCAMYEIEVERCSSVRDALMRLSKPDWTSQFFRFVFDVNLQVDDTDLEIFPKPIDLTRDLVGLEFYSLLSERAPSPFSEHIQPKSIFYTKMISAERIRRAETFARENGVGFVRKSAGLTASQFLKDLGLLT
jgi:hypothetical protein